MFKKESIFIPLLLIGIGIAGRMLPHVWNTTPITAIILFSSAYLGFRRSMVIFFTMMIVTDVFIGAYQWQIMLAVYGSFILSALIGLLMQKKRTVGLVFASAISSSVLFFLVTNWAVWQFSTMYAHSWNGLLQSYFMALPFFKNSLVGDIFYSGILFGAYELYVTYSLRVIRAPFFVSKIHARTLLQQEVRDL